MTTTRSAATTPSQARYLSSQPTSQKTPDPVTELKDPFIGNAETALHLENQKALHHHAGQVLASYAKPIKILPENIKETRKSKPEIQPIRVTKQDQQLAQQIAQKCHGEKVSTKDEKEIANIAMRFIRAGRLDALFQALKGVGDGDEEDALFSKRLFDKILARILTEKCQGVTILASTEKDIFNIAMGFAKTGRLSALLEALKEIKSPLTLGWLVSEMDADKTDKEQFLTAAMPFLEAEQLAECIQGLSCDFTFFTSDEHQRLIWQIVSFAHQNHLFNDIICQIDKMQNFNVEQLFDALPKQIKESGVYVYPRFIFANWIAQDLPIVESELKRRAHIIYQLLDGYASGEKQKAAYILLNAVPMTVRDAFMVELQKIDPKMTFDDISRKLNNVSGKGEKVAFQAAYRSALTDKEILAVEKSLGEGVQKALTQNQNVSWYRIFQSRRDQEFLLKHEKRNQRILELKKKSDTNEGLTRREERELTRLKKERKRDNKKLDRKLKAYAQSSAYRRIKAQLTDRLHGSGETLGLSEQIEAMKKEKGEKLQEFQRKGMTDKNSDEVYYVSQLYDKAIEKLEQQRELLQKNQDDLQLLFEYPEDLKSVSKRMKTFRAYGVFSPPRVSLSGGIDMQTGKVLVGDKWVRSRRSGHRAVAQRAQSPTGATFNVTTGEFNIPARAIIIKK